MSEDEFPIKVRVIKDVPKDTAFLVPERKVGETDEQLAERSIKIVNMSTEGEFKNVERTRIHYGEFELFITILQETSLNNLNAEAIREKLDEVRKDFFCYGDREFDGDEMDYITYICEKIKKWFGDAEK